MNVSRLTLTMMRRSRAWCPWWSVKRFVIKVLLCLTALTVYWQVYQSSRPYQIKTNSDGLFPENDIKQSINERGSNRSVCPKLDRPLRVQDLQKWQVAIKGAPTPNKISKFKIEEVRLADHLRVKLYVFSAYFDHVYKADLKLYPVVRIISIGGSDIRPYGVFCHLWYDRPTDLLITRSDAKLIPEHHGRLYKPFYFICPLPSSEVPYAVSLVTKECERPTNLLPVQSTPTTQPEHPRYTVCVTPLNYKYNNPYELIEMIEVNRLFGAEKFVFYNYSTGPKVDIVLEQYKAESVVDVIPWKLPMGVDTWPHKSKVEIHYFGQVAALNDCLYRNRMSPYIAFTDLDEIIVPRKHETWDELFSEIDKGSVPTFGAFIFRCTFFRKEWPDVDLEYEGKSLARRYRINSLLKGHRELAILPPYLRSKLIVVPKKMEAVGVHNVWAMLPGVRDFAVDPELGMLHHYRNWEKPEEKARFLDPYMHRYAGKITENVKLRWEKLKNLE